MIRMLVTIPEIEKKWLMKTARKENVSTAELVRRAILLYREQLQHSKKQDIKKLLNKTKGTWKQGDGLAYQQKLRDEWK